MEQVDLQSLIEQGKIWIEETDPVYLIGGGVVLLVLLILPFIGRGKRRKKKQAARIAPKLVEVQFQIAPLGRDALFKLQNVGDKAVLSNIKIKGRKDLINKNNVAGYELERNKSCKVFLETTANQKIQSNFSIELTFMDQIGNVYIQQFRPGSQQKKGAKLTKLI